MANTQPPRAPLILVVDDDVRTASVLVRLLHEDGFDVELAIDGAEAIVRLSRDPKPNMLVTDLWLPKVDGMTVARYARSHLPGLPVFIITGHPQQISQTSSPTSTPIRVFTKPFDYGELYTALRQSIEQPRLASGRAA